MVEEVVPVVPGYTVHRVPIPARLGEAEGTCLSDAGHVGISAERGGGVVLRGRFRAIPARGGLSKVRVVDVAADGTIGCTLSDTASGAITRTSTVAMVVRRNVVRIWGEAWGETNSEIFAVRSGGVALVGTAPIEAQVDYTPPRLHLWTPSGRRDLGIGETGGFGDDGTVYGSYPGDARGHYVSVLEKEPERIVGFRWRNGRRTSLPAPVLAARGAFRIEDTPPPAGIVLRTPGRTVPVPTSQSFAVPPSDRYRLLPGPQAIVFDDPVRVWSRGRWRNLSVGGVLADVNSRGWLLVNGYDVKGVYVLKPR